MDRNELFRLLVRDLQGLLNEAEIGWPASVSGWSLAELARWERWEGALIAARTTLALAKEGKDAAASR